MSKVRTAFLVVLAMVMVMFWTFSVQAYTINDSPSDAIGAAIYESYGINVYNFTPGANSGSIMLDLFTNFPQAGETVNGSPPWTTRPADLFITETYFGNPVEWAIPLVSHDGFVAGGFYQVGSFLTSDKMDPSGGTGYIYNHGVKVLIASGTQLANQSGSVLWNSLGTPGNPDWYVRINTGIFEDDPNGSFSFLWGTATCANDIITGQVPQVPIPPTALLMGTGLLGLVGLGFRRRGSKSTPTA